MSNLANIKRDMQAVLDALETELRALRPGRASGDLVGTLPVPLYGSTMPIQQAASISMNEQGQLVIQPWDKANMGAIEKAIRDSQLGFSIVNEGPVLRLSVPPMSQERRLEFVKMVHQKGEAARIQLRQMRSDNLQKASREKSAGLLREDELNRLTKELNETIEEFNKQVKSSCDAKEKELLSA